MAESSTRRAQLQARLAAERANLLYQLRGLDEETLCSAEFIEGWTVRDLFPHLGFWDAWATQRTQLVLDDRRSEIQWLDGPEEVDRINDNMRQMTDRRSLSEALAVALKERNAFLVTLSRTPDDLLFRRIQIRPGWRSSIYTWSRRRFLHDARHAADIQQWRKSIPRSSGSAPASKLILRPFLSASRQEMMSMALLVPPQERATRPIKGAWTLKDTMGLIAVYEFMGVQALKDLAEGKSPEFSKTIRNFQMFNEAQIVARQDESWTQTLEEYRIVRKGLLALLDHLSDEALMRPFVAPWGAPITGYQYLFGLAIHEQEQAAAVRHALHLRPLPARLRHFRPT